MWASRRCTLLDKLLSNFKFRQFECLENFKSADGADVSQSTASDFFLFLFLPLRSNEIFLHFFSTLKGALGGVHAVQWLFAAVSICGFAFGLWFLPETHGKKLSEIEAYFSGEANRPEKKSKKIGPTNRKLSEKLGIVQETELMIKEGA